MFLGVPTSLILFALKLIYVRYFSQLCDNVGQAIKQIEKEQDKLEKDKEILKESINKLGIDYADS